MKKLAIDIKDNYAVVVAGGDFKPEFIKIDFGEIDFTPSDENDNAPPCLFDMGNTRIAELYKEADQAVLSTPMRFSLVKSLSIDQAGIAGYGDDFLRWEAFQQLPEELGQFIFGFKKLGESYDNKYGNYLYYAAPQEFMENLLNFASPDPENKPVLGSEALGLLNIINTATDNKGFCAAISIEQDGASVILSRDGVFISARFIQGEKPESQDASALGDEIMYYILSQAPEDIKPGVLICGDLNQIDTIGVVDWADMLVIPDNLKPLIMPGVGGPGPFTAAAGLIINNQ